MAERLTGEDRCWPCTAANAFVGLLVAWVPFVAALVDGSPGVVIAVGLWAVSVTGYTMCRLVARGYLPAAGPMAKLTGLHDRISPELGHDRKKDR